MPSEKPQGGDNYKNLLQHGANRHLPLQAYEVAWSGEQRRNRIWVAVALMAAAGAFLIGLRR